MQNSFPCVGEGFGLQDPTEASDPFGTVADRLLDRFQSSNYAVTPLCKIRLNPVASCVLATTGPETRREEFIDEFTCEEHDDERRPIPVLDMPLVETYQALQDDLKLAQSSEPSPKSPSKARTRTATDRAGSIATSKSSQDALLPLHNPQALKLLEDLRKANIGKILHTDPNIFSSTVLGQSLHERVSRIQHIYETYKDERKAAESAAWTFTSSRKHTQSNLPEVKFSCSFTNSLVKSMASMEVKVTKNIDMLKVFAALCEYDLSTNYISAHSSCRQVRSKKASVQSHVVSGDMIWQVFREPENGGKEDNIFHVSVIDALDEPFGVLLVAVYTPDDVLLEPGEFSEDLTEVSGIQLPKVEECLVRVRDEKVFFALRRTSESRFEVKCLMTSRLSKAGQTFPGILERDCRQMLQQLHEFVITNKELRSRMHFSEHHDLYENIRYHLKGSQRDMLNSMTEPMLEDWSDICTQLPEDWSDYNEDLLPQKSQLFL